MARCLAMKVVVLLQLPGQTKESARRDDHMFLLVGCGPYVSIVWGSAICFYYAALGHMFLLCGARPYVSIVCVCVCVCVCACVTIFFHRLAPSQGRNLLALNK